MSLASLIEAKDMLLHQLPHEHLAPSLVGLVQHLERHAGDLLGPFCQPVQRGLRRFNGEFKFFAPVGQPQEHCVHVWFLRFDAVPE